MNIRKVTVLGAGNLGAQIAFRVAYHGFDTTSYDISDEALQGARGRFESIADNYAKDLPGVSKEDARKAFDHLTQTSDLAEAVKDADLIIEAVPEHLALKQETGLDPRSWTRCRFGYAASARVADVVSA